MQGNTPLDTAEEYFPHSIKEEYRDFNPGTQKQGVLLKITCTSRNQSWIPSVSGVRQGSWLELSSRGFWHFVWSPLPPAHGDSAGLHPRFCQGREGKVARSLSPPEGQMDLLVLVPKFHSFLPAPAVPGVNWLQLWPPRVTCYTK